MNATELRQAYSFQLRWQPLRPGLELARQVYCRFAAAVEGYLESLGR